MQKYPKILVSYFLGARGIIKVDPAKIELKVASSKVECSIFSRRRSRAAGKYDSKKPNQRVHPILRSFILPYPVSAVEISDWTKFLNLQNYYENIENPERSNWYKAILQKIKQHGVYEHKHDRLHCEADVQKFFDLKMKPLFKTLRDTGYDTSIASDMGTVFIDADGRLVKGSGADHRFCAARLVGTGQIPLRVQGVSQDWFLREVGPKMDVGGLGDAIASAAQRASA
jgi:hypothetical protein